MDVDILEGRLAHNLHAEGDRPRHPEEDNVVSRHQDAGGIEEIQLRRLVRPAQRGEGPEPGGEPGIQHVLILVEVCASAFFAGFRHFPRHRHLAAFVAVIGGNPMPPPELAGNAPVADIFHPVIINFIKPLGDKLHIPSAHGLNGRFCQLLHGDEPLAGHHGFHSGMAAVAGAYVMGIVLFLHKNARRL